MQALLAPLRELAEYEEIRNILYKDKKSIALTGCVESQKLHMIYGLGDGFPCKVIVTYSDLKVREIYEDYKFYDRNVYLYPAKDLIFFQADIHGNKLTAERVKVLRRLAEKKPITIVTTFSALMTPQARWEIDRDTVSISKHGTLDMTEVSKRLVNMGYEKTYQVEAPGQFAVRGGILDVFDLTEENPYRIELWGDEVDSVRSFDILSQRSVEQLSSIRIFPAAEFVLTEEMQRDGIAKIEKEAKKQVKIFRDHMQSEEAHRIEVQVKELREQVLEFKNLSVLEGYIRYFYGEEELSNLLGLLPEKHCLFLDEPARIREQAEAVELEFRESMSHRAEKGYILPGQMDVLSGWEKVAAGIRKAPFMTLASIEMKKTLVKPEKTFSISAQSVTSYNNSFEMLVKDLKQYKKEKYRVLLLSSSRTRAERLAADLREEGLSAVFTGNPEREVQEGEILTCYGHAGKGFAYPLLKFVVISESDIFGNGQKKKKRKPKYEGQKIKDFSELKVGDYVVHESHGLGIYRGIEKVEVDKVVKDYLKIEYRDGGNLYILATGLDVIQKYASADAKTPKLNKLGTQEWTKTKTRVRTAVETVAKDLVELYAKRQQSEGYQYGKDTVWQREFEEMFPYEETDDQLAAIADTKADMESRKIMDRLICGDVGYGKTEIAIRAAFKAVQEGKQVAYLVPTTILAQQHYNTFAQRMKDFPVRVDMMSRFRTAAEQKKTITDLKKGMVDIVIGTHRILSADVQFKDLGLLIIDEEQRFGVAHKEKIKQMKENVDVLTLTATPIPRTLHMSLIGIRDMSVLEEPPMDRMPIQTYVMEYDEETVREAINRELRRGGQVYYVYNRVTDIADVALRIAKLVPDARVDFAHGQMSERELENVMYSFVNGDIDVLVSTTIIETGLDISNVNTMIIHDSDRYGLSQLYQLRGRIGRSNRTAYAFLMYRKNVMLKETAEKRLAAIREYTDLGSGFKIAMRDLELRGAGNLLGAQQHGHMNAVGYDLYCKMLNEAVKEAKGIHTMEDFETSVDLNVDAYIPDSYISNEFQKLDIYKRIAGIETQQDYDDMLEELLDRFGEPGKAVLNLLAIAKLKAIAHQGYVTEIKQTGKTVRFTLYEKARLNTEGFPALMQKYRRGLQFKNEQEPKFILEPQGNLILALTEFAEELKSMAENM